MITKIIAIGIITVILTAVLKRQNSEYAAAASIVAGLLIFAMVFGDLKAIISTIRNISLRAGIPNDYIILLVKILGISYLTQFASSIAKDAGESAIAVKIEFAGKISIIVISIPVFLSLLSLITSILP